jgi:hypothetical protein
MKTLETYLHSKRNAWAPSTIAAVRGTLAKHGANVEHLTPQEFFDSLDSLGEYTRKTVFIIAAGYFGYLFPERPNSYSAFLKEYRNAFKNAYKKKLLDVSYEEVKAALEAQADGPFRRKALSLLGSAQRWTESSTAVGTTGRRLLVGKGNKQRVDLSEGGQSEIAYHSFRRKLQGLCGISPHALRKLALSRAVENGATAADLCAIAGWSTIAPSWSYLQPKDEDRLRSLLK